MRGVFLGKAGIVCMAGTCLPHPEDPPPLSDTGAQGGTGAEGGACIPASTTLHACVYPASSNDRGFISQKRGQRPRRRSASEPGLHPSKPMTDSRHRDSSELGPLQARMQQSQQCALHQAEVAVGRSERCPLSVSRFSRSAQDLELSHFPSLLLLNSSLGLRPVVAKRALCPLKSEVKTFPAAPWRPDAGAVPWPHSQGPHSLPSSTSMSLPLHGLQS